MQLFYVSILRVALYRLNKCVRLQVIRCLGIITIATKFSAEGKKLNSEIAALGRETVDVFLHHTSANHVKVIYLIFITVEFMFLRYLILITPVAFQENFLKGSDGPMR